GNCPDRASSSAAAVPRSKAVDFAFEAGGGVSMVGRGSSSDDTCLGRGALALGSGVLIGVSRRLRYGILAAHHVPVPGPFAQRFQGMALAEISAPVSYLTGATMATKTLQDLFVHMLSDIYSAEKQLTKALPKMARASSNSQLSAAFEQHLEETQGQIERIDKVVEACNIKLKRMKCVAMEG